MTETAFSWAINKAVYRPSESGIRARTVQVAAGLRRGFADDMTTTNDRQEGCCHGAWAAMRAMFLAYLAIIVGGCGTYIVIGLVQR
jgi:hypothetical protein